MLISGYVSINFRTTFGKHCINFKENSLAFWNQLLEVLEELQWSFWKIARKFRKNLRKIEKKILNYSNKITEKLSGKIEVIRN